ncbi:MAG: type II toxin-antitoxin system Phd/YefM family antitoxin [Deltaproteobacteria bacterium]|nr:type II toxin-antitoxin system Phd/YefM family antitoxin [Deltaproteobacteria bacterium]
MVYRANIHEAKTHFSKLLERAHSGDEVIVAKSGRDYARIVPINSNIDRRPGTFKGQIKGDITGPITNDDESNWG